MRSLFAMIFLYLSDYYWFSGESDYFCKTWLEIGNSRWGHDWE